MVLGFNIITVLRNLYPSQTAHQEAPQCQEERSQSDCDPSAPSAAETRKVIVKPWH